MDDKDKQPFDLTEEVSNRGKDSATAASRQAESDDVNENMALGKIPTPDGDDAGENRVTTSLSDD